MQASTTVSDGSVAKFSDPFTTANGQTRASVALSGVKTLWFNTGTLCNIECSHCYIESSPQNDRLVYISAPEVQKYLEQIKARKWPVREIGFTGGEPFMNPDIIASIGLSLEAGYEVLVLTNAMRPMMRKSVQAGLKRLNKRFPAKMTLRVSLDHWSAKHHNKERGERGFERTVEGMRWLRDNGIKMAVAGRTIWQESEAEARAEYGAFYTSEGFEIDAKSPIETVLFPEMDESEDVPEITTACWGILNKNPSEMMCASSRMVVKRKGAKTPTTLACTLIVYVPEFEFGPSLADAERAVQLNHPHCAKFCVLGGASCSG